MITYFIAGLLVGWLVEWIIDWRFWRRRDEDEGLQKQLAAVEAKLKAAEGKLKAAEGKLKATEGKLKAAEGKLKAAEGLKTEEEAMTRLRQDLATAEGELKVKEEEAATVAQELATAESKNEQLLQHLREAEILLGKHQVLEEKRQKQLTTADNQLKSQEEKVARLQRQLEQMEGGLDDFKAVQHDNELLEEQLAAAQAESQRLQRELKALEGREPELIYIIPDDLTKISGIGPAFERYLNESGIYTFAQLADLTPERIKVIIGSKQLSKIDADEWLEHARVLANYKGSYLRKDNEPDDLTRVKGIGPVFGKRLNKVGIYTFAQLADLTAFRLKELLVSPDDLPNVDAEEWISEAEQLASKKE